MFESTCLEETSPGTNVIHLYSNFNVVKRLLVHRDVFDRSVYGGSDVCYRHRVTLHFARNAKSGTRPEIA